MGVKGKQLAMGNCLDTTNPYQWDPVELNLPWSASYDPHCPWVLKHRKDRHIASDSSVYVNDGQHMGFNKVTC